MGVPSYPLLVWSAAGTDSDAMDIANITLAGFILPATFTGATVSFKVSDSFGGTYVAFYDETNTLFSWTVTQARAYRIRAADFTPWKYIKMVSASSESAGRQVKLAGREFS